MSESGFFGGSLHASVPRHEMAWAERVLPGAAIIQGPVEDCPARLRPNVRVLTVSSQDRVDPALLDRFPALQAVVTRSTGCDRLPLAELEERGVRAFHLDGYATESVAQHALMFLLMLLRRVPEAVARTRGAPAPGAREPRWDRSDLQGRNLDEVTVGVLGTGRIGSRVVRMLSALQVSTVGHDITPDPSLQDVAGFRYARSLPPLLAASDALTIHVPLTAATRAMINADTIKQLPTGAVLVNTARGDVVDQRAVADALRSGELAGYAADVLPGEPDPPELARFQETRRVVLTPHLAAYDNRALMARYEATAFVTRHILEGTLDPLKDHVPVVW